jgi:hypothetical protein
MESQLRLGKTWNAFPIPAQSDVRPRTPAASIAKKASQKPQPAQISVLNVDVSDLRYHGVKNHCADNSSPSSID